MPPRGIAFSLFHKQENPANTTPDFRVKAFSESNSLSKELVGYNMQIFNTEHGVSDSNKTDVGSEREQFF